MIERIGAENMFVHLDTYHMNIEEKVPHRRSSMRGITSATSTCQNPTAELPGWVRSTGMRSSWRFVPSTSRAAGYGKLREYASRNSFGLSVWRPVARDEAEVMEKGLPFLRNKAAQYGLI